MKLYYHFLGLKVCFIKMCEILLLFTLCYCRSFFY